MTKPIGLQFDSYLSRKLEQKAKEYNITPEQLISLYIKYGLLHHKRIIEFETKVRNVKHKKCEILR